MFSSPCIFLASHTNSSTRQLTAISSSPSSLSVALTHSTLASFFRKQNKLERQPTAVGWTLNSFAAIHMKNIICRISQLLGFPFFKIQQHRLFIISPQNTYSHTETDTHFNLVDAILVIQRATGKITYWFHFNLHTLYLMHWHCVYSWIFTDTFAQKTRICNVSDDKHDFHVLSRSFPENNNKPEILRFFCLVLSMAEWWVLFSRGETVKSYWIAWEKFRFSSKPKQFLGEQEFILREKLNREEEKRGNYERIRLCLPPEKEAGYN